MLSTPLCLSFILLTLFLFVLPDVLCPLSMLIVLVASVTKEKGKKFIAFLYGFSYVKKSVCCCFIVCG